MRENNQAVGYTYVWDYDKSGNILSRTKYNYTTGALGAATETINYSYSDSGWGDIMTSYNGIDVHYDGSGNFVYDGTNLYTWEHGHELAAITPDDQGTEWTFAYNADGMRIQRSNGETTYKYVYTGGQLSQMTVGSNTLRFTYDADGTPLTVIYNGTTYYYATNLQGDVVAILNSAGTAVVTYTYDAWGNILGTTDTTNFSLSTKNPLRYRGYVYDQETGLYYLQSRYYNPQWGRFISADSFISTGQGLIGNNMFAYCGNNPVIRKDSSGDFWDIVFDVVSIGFSIADVIKKPKDPLAWAALGADAASAVIPFLSGGGTLVKAATKADDVFDVVKSADNLNDIGRFEIIRPPEVKLPNQIKANDAVAKWDDFLGPNQTNYNRFTGDYDANRIFSADGTRSIRFGNHEMDSIGTTKAHFHYEYWERVPNSNLLYYRKILQRLK